jgi:hypothetical protein
MAASIVSDDSYQGNVFAECYAHIAVIAIELVAVKFGNSLFFYIIPNYCRAWARNLIFLCGSETYVDCRRLH